MPSIKLSVPHKLGADEAKRRITHLLEDTKGKLGNVVTNVQESWSGNKGAFTFHAMGFPVSGTLDVEPTLVNLEVKLPFAALPFKGKMESELQTKAKELLA
jgi:hypothetical protein